MAEDRPVPFDSRGDLWSAVADGIVVSQDLSPSLKFKLPGAAEIWTVDNAKPRAC